MLLRRLKIKDFLAFKDADLYLENTKLASVIGQHASDKRRSNGAGKTALVECIRYALFDQTRSKHKLGIVRQGSDNCIVELEFRVGDHDLKVQRTRTSIGASSAKVWVDGKSAGDKITVVNEVIQQHLGIDSELFDLIYFFKQRDQFKFTESNPGERKSALSKVFRMGNLDRCLAIAKEKMKFTESSLQKATGWENNVSQRFVNTPDEATLIENHLQACERFTAVSIERERLQSIVEEISSSNSEFKENYRVFEDEVAKKYLEADNAAKKANECLNKISVLQTSSQQVVSEIGSSKARRDQLREEMKPLAVIDIDELNASISSDESNRDKLVGDKAKHEFIIKNSRSGDDVFGLAGKKCPKCKQVVSVEHAEKIVNNDKMHVAVSKKEIESIQSAISSIDVKIKQKRENVKKYHTYESLKKEAAQVDKHISSLEAKHREIQKDIDDLVVERDKNFEFHSRLSLDLQELDIKSLRERMISIMNALGRIERNTKSALTDLIGKTSIAENEYSMSERDLNEHYKIVEELNQARESVKIAQDEYTVYNHLSTIFGKNGLQALLIENAIGVIEKFANEILDQMQTNFRIALKTQKETKAGEQRETLEIIVFRNGVEMSFENYSGGEQTIINLAIRISLSKVVGSLHGIEVKTLFLDEVLAELDPVNREIAVRIISFFSKSFDQVFVISHTSEIQDMVDSSIIIMKYDDYSTAALTTQNAGIPL